MKINIKKAILFFSVLALFLSIYIAYETASNSQICVIGKGCSVVQNSEYNALFGIKLAYLGLIAFIVLLLISLLVHKKRLSEKYFTLSTILGSIFAIYFIFLQVFIIKALCSSCLAIDSIMIIIFILELLRIKRKSIAIPTTV